MFNYLSILPLISLRIFIGFLLAASFLFQWIAPPFAQAQGKSNEYDIRGPFENSSPNPPSRANPQLKGAIASLKSGVPGLTIRYSALTNAVSRLYSISNPLTGPSTLPPQQVALNFLNQNLVFFNLSPSDFKEYRTSRNFISSHNGLTHLTIQQQYNGIDIFGGIIRINIDSQGQVLNFNGQPIPGIAGINVSDTPSISVEEAIEFAAAHAGINNINLLDTFQDGVIYFPMGLGNLILAWNVFVAEEKFPE